MTDDGQQFWDRVTASGHDPAVVARVMQLDDNYSKALNSQRSEHDNVRVYSAGGFADQVLGYYKSLIDFDRREGVRHGLTSAEINVIIKCIRREQGMMSTILIDQIVADCGNMVAKRIDVLAETRQEKEKRPDQKRRY